MAGEPKTIRKDGRAIPVPTTHMSPVWVASFP